MLCVCIHVVTVTVMCTPVCSLYLGKGPQDVSLGGGVPTPVLSECRSHTCAAVNMCKQYL